MLILQGLLMRVLILQGLLMRVDFAGIAAGTILGPVLLELGLLPIVATTSRCNHSCMYM
jgi:hypothetical protein